MLKSRSNTTTALTSGARFTMALMLSGFTVATIARAAGTPAVQPAANAAGGALQEVVVTAERHTQSVQKSSLAIAVIKPEELEKLGITDVRDLTKFDPGVQIGQGGAATQIYIRGVGDFGSTSISNPAVAFNVDGVYVSRSNGAEGNFYDVQRVEVLKGPQGTLYGRNATGGAINVIPNKPSLKGFSGHLEAEVGNYAMKRTEGFVNVPIAPTFAIRTAFEVVSRHGYSDLGFDDDHHESVRVSALWKPSDDLTMQLTLDHTHVGGTGPGYVVKGPLPSALASLMAAQGATAPSGDRSTYLEPGGQAEVYAAAAAAGLCIPGFAPADSATIHGTVGPASQGACPSGFLSLAEPGSPGELRSSNNNLNNITPEFDYNLGFATLTALLGYREVRNDYITFPLVVYDDAAQDRPEHSDTYSAELRLGNSTPALTWTVGLYHYREDQTQNGGENLLLTGNIDTQDKIRTMSNAAFGQATYSLEPNWRLIGGARYTVDSRSITGDNLVYDTPFLGLPYVYGNSCFLQSSPCVNDRFNGKHDFYAFNYKVGTEYDLTPANMLFATYSTGYKAGGFNSFSNFGAPNVASTYAPEKLDALEVGSRNRFFDRQLQVNLEGFYWKYHDPQVLYTTENANGGPEFGYTNAGEATMYGIDLDVLARVTPVDVIHASVENLESRYDSFIYPSPTLASFATSCRQTSGDGPLGTVNCTGKPLERAPKWDGTVSYTHTFAFSNGATLDAELSAQFASSRYLTVDYTPQSLAAGYIEGDANLSYRAPAGNWTVSVYCRNFNNATIYTGGYSVPYGLPGLVAANIGAPRTFGATAGFDF